MVDKETATAILHALEGGMVPEYGLPYIAVGRREEVEMITHDMERIAEGYSTFRLLEGAYGSGKSFMAQLIKNEAMLRGFVVMDCELASDRKLCGSKKEGLETYRLLLSRLSTKKNPHGHGLEDLLDQYAEKVLADRSFGENVKRSICQMPHGYDFQEALDAYVRICEMEDKYDNIPSKNQTDTSREQTERSQNKTIPSREQTDRSQSQSGLLQDTKNQLLRWFRGEYPNKTTARRACGLSVIVEDDKWFAYLKIWAVFFRLLDYKGLYIILDELTQITRNITNSITREHNFERLLSIYNDCYGGEARGMGIILCGIPSSIHDPRRGIFSYEALKSRLEVSSLQGEDILGGPIIKLSMLTAEEFVVLLDSVEAMHKMLYVTAQQEEASNDTITQQEEASNDTITQQKEASYDTISQQKEASNDACGQSEAASYYFSEEERITFVEYEYGRIGAANHLTPREFLRDYLTILNQKAGSRSGDSMEDFLYRGSGLDTTPSMIGQSEADDLDDLEAMKYEGFTL